MQKCIKLSVKGLFRLILIALLLALVLTGIGPRAAQADPGWYDSAWTYRKKITINSANVTATLTDFPVLISLASDSNLANSAQSDGDDILFTGSDGISKLSHEIEKFDGNTGELVAWVKVPSLSSTVDTDIYMYYGNSGAGNQQNATFVWDSNHKMVQHLQETTGGANAIQDSTSNTNHGTDSGSPTLGATGKINSATGFDASNDYIDFGNDTSLNLSSDFNISFWMKPNVKTGTYRDILAFNSGAINSRFQVAFQSSNLQVYTNDGAWHDTGKTVTLDVWSLITFIKASNTLKLYINGTDTGWSMAHTNQILAGSNLYLGHRAGWTVYYGGVMDEVRISDTSRGADWIQTSYNNQNTPSSFFTLGSEESGAPTAVGGTVYPVDKTRVLLPWLLLLSVLPLATARWVFRLRKSA